MVEARADSLQRNIAIIEDFLGTSSSQHEQVQKAVDSLTSHQRGIFNLPSHIGCGNTVVAVYG